MDTDTQSRRLVARAQAGERRALEELFGAHRTRLESFIRHRLGGRNPSLTVEDVAQEAFVRALRGLGEFRWRGDDSFARWLVGIAHNVLREVERQAGRARYIGLEGEARRGESDVPQGQHLRRKERLERLERSLAGLARDEREVIALAKIDALPLREVARRMKRSHGATRQLLWRALRKLKERFGDTESLRLPDPEDRDGEREVER